MRDNKSAKLRTLRQCFMGNSFESDIRVRYPGIDWDNRAKKVLDIMKELHANQNVVLRVDEIHARVRRSSPENACLCLAAIPMVSISFMFLFISLFLESADKSDKQATTVNQSALWGFIFLTSSSIALILNGSKQKQIDEAVGSVSHFIQTLPNEMFALGEFHLLEDYAQHLRLEYSTKLFFPVTQEYEHYALIVTKLEQKFKLEWADKRQDCIEEVSVKFPNASLNSRRYLADLIKATNSDPQIALQI